MTPLTIGLKDAASAIGVSIWTLRKRIRQGKLPCIRIGSRVLLEVSELKRLIEEGRQQQ